MKIGERCYVHGYIDEIRKDTVIVRNKGGYFGTDPSEVLVGELPERKTGFWIPQDFNKSDGMKTTAVYYCPKCSVCGHAAMPTNFCPNCGSDMRGEIE